MTGIAGLGVEWVSFDDGYAEADFTLTGEPAKPMPEIPPPCWDERKVDPEKAIQAVRAMCGGSK